MGKMNGVLQAMELYKYKKEVRTIEQKKEILNDLVENFKIGLMRSAEEGGEELGCETVYFLAPEGMYSFEFGALTEKEDWAALGKGAKKYRAFATVYLHEVHIGHLSFDANPDDPNEEPIHLCDVMKNLDKFKNEVIDAVAITTVIHDEALLFEGGSDIKQELFQMVGQPDGTIRLKRYDRGCISGSEEMIEGLRKP